MGRVTGRSLLPSPTLRFDVVDVFTDTAFSGNPLAVVHGAQVLSTAQLQSLAREFHLSETAFPVPPTEQESARGVHYRLRIFTPSTELPFAGHPSVGTAWLLAGQGTVVPGRVVQACGAGDLPLQVTPDGGPVTLTGGPAQVGEALDRDEAAAWLGLAREDLLDIPPGIAGTGLAFGYVYVKGEALGRARLVGGNGLGVDQVYVVAWPPPGEADDVRARMFATDIGVPEDPATGSAALGLAVHALSVGLLMGEGTSRFVVRQGVEMGRPSTLVVEVDAQGGQTIAARVSGNVVAISSGEVAIPSA